MKESLATAVNTSDLKQRDKPCPVDKITSLGFASIGNSIGADAIRFMYALQPKSYDTLLIGLSRKLRSDRAFKHTSIQMRHSISALVIAEETLPSCRCCNGAREFRAGNLVKLCPVCNGSGVHRYSDESRAHDLKLSIEDYVNDWAKRVDIAKKIFTEQINNTMHTVYKKNENNLK